ncbi:MAG TPA: ferredoxin, partial [Clostridiales bacterium]|nr:ferredoxin [Clostridiales bacterium]
VENLYVAKNRNRQQMEDTPAFYREIEAEELRDTAWEKPLIHYDVSTLDPDMMKAMEKLRKMNEIYERLPALDCGACGSPSCRALAEDVVRGKARMTDCIFILRRKIKRLANEMMMFDNGFTDGTEEENENQ